MIISTAFRVFPRLIGYKLASNNLIKTPGPLIFNFSVTNKCNSKCKTCNIWQLYKKSPKKLKEELTLEEIEKIFKSMDPVFQFTICGGEPYLRDDLGDICGLGAKYLNPKIIHMPTNCLASDRIEKITKDMLSKIPETTNLTIKMSIDGVGEKHDKIRGVKGNFKKIIKAHDILTKLREKHPNLYVDAGATVSNFNLKNLDEIQEFVDKNFKLDNFIHELADNREELFNIDLSVTPSGKEYSKTTGMLCDKLLNNMKGKRKLSKIAQALRIVYYKRAAKVMKEGKRQTPCYAGSSNCYLSPWGDLWICNVQASKMSMGNLKDFNYDFKKVWHSKRAQEIRRWVNESHCYCPLAGQGILDTMMNIKELAKVFYYYVRC